MPRALATSGPLHARRKGVVGAEGARIMVKGRPGRGFRGKGPALVEIAFATFGRALDVFELTRDEARAFCARIFAELGRAEERVG